jgi:hypothetical protein
VVSETNYKLNNRPLALSQQVKDLGLNIDEKLKLTEHISVIVRKAMSRARLILKCFTSRNKDLLDKAFIIMFGLC